MKFLPRSFGRSIEKRFPNTYGLLRGSRNLLRSAWRNVPFQRRAERELFDRGDCKCLSGPFAGMRYFNLPVWASITPKWVGTYELEIVDFIQKIIVHQPTVVVDVGCAEGYYAVGLARALPESSVFAYDTDIFAQGMCRHLARLNGVEKTVKVFGYLDPETWSPMENSALILDIEGFEYEFLSSIQPQLLANCLILVEVHQRFQGDISQRELSEWIADRFRSSHEIISTPSRPRCSEDMPVEIREKLSGATPEAMMDEQRGQDMIWMFLQPKN
jgi:hypothetical protein